MVASVRQQYGLRIRGEEFASMPWDEFSDLVAGLNETTPLVRVAQIRTEEDPEALKSFTPEQLRMRSEWRRRRAAMRTEDETGEFLAAIQAAFAKMFGEGA